MIRSPVGNSVGADCASLICGPTIQSGEGFKGNFPSEFPGEFWWWFFGECSFGDAPELAICLNHFVLIDVCSTEFLVVWLKICTGLKWVSFRETHRWEHFGRADRIALITCLKKLDVRILNNQAFNTEWNVQSRMVYSIRAPLWPQKKQGPDWNFQARMKISIGDHQPYTATTKDFRSKTGFRRGWCTNCQNLREQQNGYHPQDCTGDVHHCFCGGGAWIAGFDFKPRLTVCKLGAL